MGYKLVAIDMDGTLLNSKNQVSERTIEAINNAKKKGVHIVLSTGRILKSASYYSKSLGLRNPIIASNGALMVDGDYNIFYKKPLEMNLVKDIADLALKEKIYCHFYDETSFYSNIKIKEVLEFYNEGNESLSIDIKIYKDISEIVERDDLNIYKFLFIENNKEKLQSFRNKLQTLENINISSSWSNNVEAMKEKVSKGEALRVLSKILNINPSEIIAIGDSENDLSMLSYAGLAVAMGNGDNNVKEKASYITDSNDRDGVAKVIEKFILG